MYRCAEVKGESAAAVIRRDSGASGLRFISDVFSSRPSVLVYFT